MKRAVGFCHNPTNVTESAELVRQAEQQGFRSAWIPDQPFYCDPYVVLAAAAAETERIKLGVGVTNPFTAHPAISARIAASVAQLAPGRFRVGIAAGNKREFLRPLGADRAGPADEWCEAAVSVMKTLWEGKRVYRETPFRTQDVALTFEAPPGIEIFVAGLGPKMLSAAARCADGVIANLVSDIGFAATSHDIARAAGDSSAPKVIAWAMTLLSEGADAQAERDRLRPFVAHLLAPASSARFETLRIASAVARQLKTDYHQHGPDHAARHITDEMIEHFAIVGPPAYVGERIDHLLSLGASEVVLNPYTDAPQEISHVISMLGRHLLASQG